MKLSKKIFFIILLFFTYLFVSIFSYSNAVSSNISEEVFRLHVIANSDSVEDQNLKYNVRDELLTYMNSLCENVSTKDEAITLALNHKTDFYNIAKKVIAKNGFNYDVKISIGNFSFPTKYYGDVSLPAGFYDALKVEIGSAEGKNWWCVMFPSLCFVDVSSGYVDEDSKENLEENLDAESYNLISSNDTQYKFKFKLIELIESTKIIIAKK